MMQKPIVHKKFRITSLKQMIESNLPRIKHNVQTHFENDEHLLQYLLILIKGYMDYLIRDIATVQANLNERIIGEVVERSFDEDWYEKHLEQQKVRREKIKQHAAMQEFKKQFMPEPEIDKRKRAAYLQREIEYHEQQAERCRRELEELG